MTSALRKVLLLGAASLAASAAYAQSGKKGDDDAEVKFTGPTALAEGDAAAEAGLGAEPHQMFGGGRYPSLLIGGPRGVGPLTSEGAYAYARGGFGQIVVGREEGAARTLAVASPTLFRAVNVNDWRADLSGLNGGHPGDDLAGYSTNVTYMPPANALGGVLGGLQIGVSYAPSLRNCGERLCASGSGFVLAPDGTLLTETSHWEDAVEGALYYQKGVKIGRDRLFLGLGASVVTAQEDALATSPIFGAYESYAVGLNLGFRGITIGGSIKSTNAGLANLDKDGYLAFDAGVTFKTGEEGGDWGFMLGYGQAEATAIGVNPVDPILFRDTQTAQAGVTYYIDRGITIGAAAQFVESQKPDAAGGREEAATVVIESSIKF